MLAGESELYNLGVFDWANVGPRKPISDQTDEEAVIKVHEAKRNTITYGFGLEIAKRGGNVPAGTLAVPGLPPIGIGNGENKFVSGEKTFVSPRGTVEFTRRNIRGLAETGTISLLLARLDQRLLATYADPQFRVSHWRTLTSLSAERNTQNPLFAATLGSGSFRAKTTTAQFRYEFTHTSLSQILVPQVVLPEDRHVRLSTLSAAILRDTRDQPLDAHTGRYETLNIGITPRLLGSSASFTRMLGQYAYYRPVHGIVWANSIRLGLAKAYNGSFVPTSERFFAGGGTTLRGFPINGAGPQRSVTICTNPNDTSTCVGNIRVPIGGNQLFVLSSELRIPLPIKEGLGFVAFYDGGNVYRNISFRQCGTIADPQLTARVQVQELQYQRTTLTGVRADLAVANHRADLTLASGVANASLNAKASVNLSGNYYATGAFDTTSVPIAQLASIYAPSIPTELQGSTEVHATFKGPLRNYQQIEAHLLIPKLAASYQTLRIENVGPIKADVSDGLAILQPSELKGTGTSVKFHGQVPLRSGAPMTLAAQGNVDVRLLQLLSPDLRTSGIVALDVRGAGNVTHPTVEGTIRLQKVNLATVSAPIGLEQVDGALTIANDRLQINQLNGQLGGGQIAAGGFVALRPQLKISLAVNAKSIRLRYPEGMRAILDSNLTFPGTTEAATLDGRVLVDSLSFTQDFDLANFIGQYSGSSVLSAGNSLADKIKMNVAIQSAEQLAATSSEVSIEGSANRRLIGTAGNPVIVGRADLTSGEIFFMNKRYQLERGVINFTDPNRTNPVLNMLITTVVKQYNISLTVIGPIDNLRTSYVSDPSLPPVDIINLIARGQTTEEATPSNLGANSVLAQGLASQVSGQVEKLAGLSSLQIDPLLGGNNTNPSAGLAIQQRVTKSFQFTFSIDLTSAQNEVVQGEYQLNKRWSMSVTRDESGGFAVDGKFHTNF